MRPEDLEKVKKLIEQSGILSQVEKAEWSQLLPQMNDKQVLELMKILTPAVSEAKDVAVAAQPKKPWELTIDTKEKELPAPQSQFEPELPAPQKSSQPAAGPAAVPAPRSPEDLQKLVEKMAGSRTPAPTKIPIPNKAPIPNKPLEHSDKPAAVSHEPQPPPPEKPPEKPVEKRDEDIFLDSPDDFAKISPDAIHGKDPVPILQSLLNAMAAFVQRNHSYEPVTQFQKSPLYQAYVNVGLALLNDSSEDRAVAFENVLRSLKSGGKDYLTKQEFEIFADFRKQIDKLFL